MYVNMTQDCAKNLFILKKINTINIAQFQRNYVSNSVFGTKEPGLTHNSYRNLKSSESMHKMCGT